MNNQSILPYVSRPGRYLGNEFNSIRKEWHKVKIRFALIFPDLYEIGMSHLGLQILYHILNQDDTVLAERCFSPDLDAERVLVDKNLPLLSLESASPLSSFDVLGFTLPYELCYSNILTILKLSNIPFTSRDRQSSHPIILGGGSCSLNPEPVADFFDAILLGDGEEAVVEIAREMKKAKEEKLDRGNTLARLAEIKGVYIPAHFSVQYDEKNRISDICAVEGTRRNVERRILADLGTTSHMSNPLVPNAKIVHDRLGVEIARGCTRGCRFCQAGMIYRPVRERSVEQIMELAGAGIDNSGFEELALLSLSTGDYSCINHLLPKLMDNFAELYVSVSMPSMRVGTLSQPVMDQIKRVRKTGFTVAPEAGSERLRQVINKGITEEDLLKTCEDAFSMGWNTIKLYFMIGLPTESMEDVREIALLAKKVAGISVGGNRRRRQVTTSIGTFVPKPHTPFQRQRQLSVCESRERIEHLKRNMPKKGVKLKYHDPEMSFLEGVFSRGDRRLGPLIARAWNLGARFDGWSEHFDLHLWQQAAEQCNIDLPFYLRARLNNEVLPWHHLSSGIDSQFLEQELAKSKEGTYTPDCRYNGCQGCGLCDFKEIKPVVRTIPEGIPANSGHTNHRRPLENGNEDHFRYIVHYSRRGDICYLGHLEILQLIFRSLRRANIRTHFSKGFNPSPKVSFSGALPVGLESEAEYFVMDLPGPLDDPDETQKLLNSCLPPGLTIREIDPHSGKIPQSVINSYNVTLPRELTDDEANAITEYLDADLYFISRKRKGQEKEIDIRPLIEDFALTNGKTLELRIKAVAGTPGIKVQEALAHVLAWPDKDIVESKILKTAWQQHPAE